MRSAAKRAARRRALRQEKDANKKAADKGVRSLRRQLSRESLEILQPALSDLATEMGETGTTNVKKIGVTVIGYSRYTKAHKTGGPATNDIIDQVPSLQGHKEVNIVGLDLFGRRSLACVISSDELAAEELEVGRVFKESGFPLGINPQESFVPHCSIAKVYAGFEDRYKDPEFLKLLGKIPTFQKILAEPLYLEPIPKI